MDVDDWEFIFEFGDFFIEGSEHIETDFLFGIRIVEPRVKTENDIALNITGWFREYFQLFHFLEIAVVSNLREFQVLLLVLADFSS